MARPKKTAATAEACAAVKSAAKKTSAAVRAAEEKAAKPERVEEILLQVNGQEWEITNLRERAEEAYVAMGHEASSIQKLAVYLKPEEGKAYFVVNDGENGSIDL